MGADKACPILLVERGRAAQDVTANLLWALKLSKLPPAQKEHSIPQQSCLKTYCAHLKKKIER